MEKSGVGDGKLKAVLMSAGPTYEKYGFPPNSKPKCLFHIIGKTLLEMQVRVLREAGIDDIAVVAGYKIDQIRKFNKNKNLGLEVLYNPTAASDNEGSLGWIKGIDTAKVGVKSAGTDVLLIFGDVLLTVEGIQKVVEDEYKCISVYSGHGYQLYKIPKSLFPSLLKYKGRAGGMMALHDFCMQNGGIRMHIGDKPMSEEWIVKCKTTCVKLAPLRDVDYYYATDEGKAQGITPHTFRSWLNEEKAKGRRFKIE